MSGLADHIDRFAQTVKSIRTTVTILSEPSTITRGSFTRAVLTTPLGDLIRDVDHSELGLFTLVEPTQHQEKQKEEISRVEFHGATPLRRPAAARRDDAMRIKELEPEVYAQAALKYLDRYQSIRPMPRARAQVLEIIEQLASIRQNIESLNQTLAEKGPSNPAPASPKSQANAEEKRIQDLQAKIAQLKKRKEALSKSKIRLKHPPKSSVSPTTSITPSFQDEPPTPSSASATSTTPSIKDISQDSAEAAFWQTPSVPDRVMHFTDTMLMDEMPDLNDVSAGDVSTLSFGTPLKDRSEESSFHLGGADDSLEIDSDEINNSLMGDDPEEDEGDQTVRLPNPPSVASLPPVPIPASPPPPAAVDVPAPARQPKVKVNTEMERIATKIWSTVGEIIMPGNHFDVAGAGSSKPPRAKETITHLQSIASQTPSPASPSSASVSSISAPNPPSGQPTTQQILTAHLLLTLLGAPPKFSMPLNELKTTLAAKIKGDGPTANVLGGQVTTRTLYACVAKKLVKIERGGGEQVVKFDI